MNSKCRFRIADLEFEELYAHLFPGDGDEHGAVILAGLSEGDGEVILTAREVHMAVDGDDYVDGSIGYKALDPQFIHKYITRARDERLVYLAVHNHPSDESVGFSQIDIDSHVRGYPALLQIANGMPVGALVCGRRSMQIDLWLPDHTRLSLWDASVVGMSISRMFPTPRQGIGGSFDGHDRQIRMFGVAGQNVLRGCHVGIIGLGGIGSLVAEYVARLGVGEFTLVDDDTVEESNVSRIVGSTQSDVIGKTHKIGVAHRLIRNANETAEMNVIPDDVAKDSVAKSLIGCDYLFLAADSMRARLIFNALVHQYFIPGVQMGAKILQNEDALLLDVLSAVRPVRPGKGCLWCNELIDQTLLALEAKSDEERREQAYGVEEPNPSVITLNAVAAAHAVNAFLLDFLNLRGSSELFYDHFHFLNRKKGVVQPRVDPECSECSRSGTRFGRGDGVPLPSIED
ncbi:MAG: ThiF family adenylyltransferase [Acidobacteriota bacterium]|nr:MAG: ThiF family adenylyltransferase [Acidobacteriota bacterium]